VRLAVLSHPCVTPINQDLYARVQERSEWEVTILLPSRWRNEYGVQRASRWPRFRGELVPLRVGLAGNIPLHLYLAHLRRELEIHRPDVLYLHHEPYAVASFQAARAAPADLPVGFYSAQNLEKRYRWPISAWERWVFARSAFALPVTDEVAGVLRAKGYAGRTEVLPLWVDTERYSPHGARPGERPFTVGYVGRLAGEKGVDTLLDALRRVDRTRALIVGEGPEGEALRQRAAAHGLAERVRWSGYVAHDDMVHAYRSMDVLVVPSKTVPGWKEQFGRVVPEALACGVPVVTSDSGELPGLVRATGGGWTFPEGRDRDLAGLLERLGADEDSRRGRAAEGREAVKRLFGADAVADRLGAVLSDVLAARRAQLGDQPDGRGKAA
jgi:glycosyltransferase involved in cell wall biosynthesis